MIKLFTYKQKTALLTFIKILLIYLANYEFFCNSACYSICGNIQSKYKNHITRNRVGSCLSQILEYFLKRDTYAVLYAGKY